MVRKYIFATFGYVVITMAIAYPWHMIFFHDLYLKLGAYTRPEPIVEFGLISMLIQGFIMSYLYSFFYRGGHPILKGIVFGLIYGSVVYSVMGFAMVAKIDINPISTYLVYNGLFQIIQFVLTGAVIGLIFGRDIRKVEVA